jgi:hypothetical protein
MLLSISVADPGPFFTPGSGIDKNQHPGWVKNQHPGSGMNIPDHISENLETGFWVKILEFFYADPGSRDGKNSDPGWKKFGSGINIPDPQHCCLQHRFGITAQVVLALYYYLWGRRTLPEESDPQAVRCSSQHPSWTP